MLYHIISIIRKSVLLFTLFLILNGWGIFSNGKYEQLFMYSNLTTFSFWVIFLMGSVILAPLGRVFCSICPAGELNYVFSKIGLKKKFNLELTWLQAISLIIIFTLVISFHISRHPHYTSLLILLTLIIASILGVLFKGNIFCLILCPANGFLKFYSKFSFFTIKCDKNPEIYNQCMVFLNPCNHEKENCHLCLRCFKKSKGLKLAIESPDIKKKTNYTFQDFLIFSTLSGLIIMAFIRVVREIRELYVYPPYLFIKFLNIDENYIIYFVIIFGVIIYPLFFYSAITIYKKIFSKSSFKNLLFDNINYFILPIFSVHFILAFIKLNSRLGFLPYTMKDPSGKETVALYQLEKISIPPDLLPITFTKYFIFLIPIIALSFTILLLFKRTYKFKELFVHISPVMFFIVFIELCIIMWVFKGLI